MNYEIVTDSAANLPEELIEEYEISILSLSFHELYGVYSLRLRNVVIPMVKG